MLSLSARCDKIQRTHIFTNEDTPNPLVREPKPSQYSGMQSVSELCVKCQTVHGQSSVYKHTCRQAKEIVISCQFLVYLVHTLPSFCQALRLSCSGPFSYTSIQHKQATTLHS